MAEIRNDPIKDKWVIISEQRAQRPLEFGRSPREKSEDESCPFCEGNEGQTPPEVYAIRESNQSDAPGWKVRVVPNKFSALSPRASGAEIADRLFPLIDGYGYHEVIIESPSHDVELAQQPISQLVEILKVYQNRTEFLLHQEDIDQVTLFKNQGKRAGASLIHPHTQLIATPFVTDIMARETTNASNYYNLEDRCLFCDILSTEQREERRIVDNNEGFVLFAPFASHFPYELQLLPRQHSPNFTDTTRLNDLAGLLKKGLRAIQLLSDCYAAPLNFVIHTAPLPEALENRGENISDYFHWHVEIYPRITLQAGFELGAGNYINPVSPERAARFYRQHV